MANVKDISHLYKKRIDKTNNCAGCSKVIEHGEEYTQVGLPSSTNEYEVTHIALCNECSGEAKKEGVM